MTQQQTENATKWLHTIHFNELEQFLSNRLKKKLRPPQDTLISFFSFLRPNSVIMTQQQTENATKWLHTKHFNEIEPLQRLLFVLSREKVSLKMMSQFSCSFAVHCTSACFVSTRYRDRTPFFSLEFLRQ